MSESFSDFYHSRMWEAFYGEKAQAYKKDKFYGDVDPFELKEIPTLPLSAIEIVGGVSGPVLEGKVVGEHSPEEIEIGDAYFVCEHDHQKEHSEHIERGVAVSLEGRVEYDYVIQWRKRQ